jgi:hypothetical protein
MSWLRILLTAIGAMAGAYCGLIVVGGGAAGIAWLYLFGDDPWPAWSEIVIPLIALAGAVAGGWMAGVATWRSTARFA